MPRRRRGFSRLSGVGRVGFGATSIAAGLSKIGAGGALTLSGALTKKARDVGEGLMAVHSVAKSVRSGARHVRGGVRAARGQKGHPFYGNQYVKVSSRNKAKRVRG